MDTSEKVLHFLFKRHFGEYFCDNCLARELRTRGALTQMMDSLSGHSPHMRRTITQCSLCSQEKLATAAISNPQETRGTQKKLHH